MTEKASIDRFESSQAILVIGEGDVLRHVDVPKKSLPKGAKPGTWLQVEMDGDTLVSAVIDAEETARAKQRIMEKLERLRRGEQLE
jgi:hypothetical protein